MLLNYFLLIFFFVLFCLCISSLLMSSRLSSTKNAHMIIWRPLTATRTRRLSWAVCVAVRFQNRSFPQATRCTFASSLMPQCRGKAFRPLIPLVTTLSFPCLILRCIFWLFACIGSDEIQVYIKAILMSCSLTDPSSGSLLHCMLIRVPEVLPFLIWLFAKLCLLLLITVNWEEKRYICQLSPLVTLVYRTVFNRMKGQPFFYKISDDQQYMCVFVCRMWR